MNIKHNTGSSALRTMYSIMSALALAAILAIELVQGQQPVSHRADQGLAVGM